MKKLGLLLAFGILASAAPAQAKLRLVIGGKSVGTGSATVKLREDGSKQMLISLTLEQDSQTVQIRSESVYSKTGKAVSRFMETSVPSQKYRKTLIATFDDKGVSVVEDINGKRKTNKYPLEANQPREDKSEFWFIRDQPKKGDKCKVFSFSLDEGVWNLVETVYEGKFEVTIGGKKISAHRTRSEQGVAYLDDKGLPLKLELKNGYIERVW